MRFFAAFLKFVVARELDLSAASRGDSSGKVLSHASTSAAQKSVRRPHLCARSRPCLIWPYKVVRPRPVALQRSGSVKRRRGPVVMPRIYCPTR